MDELLHQLVCNLIIEIDGQGVTWGKNWDAMEDNQELVKTCKGLIVDYQNALRENGYELPPL
jgi:hypothetical protein